MASTDLASIRSYAKLMREHESRLAALESGSRTGQLAHSSIEAGSVNAYDEDGNLRQTIGRQPDGSYSIRYHTGVIPPVPNPPTVEPILSGLGIKWDGTFLDDATPAADFAHVEVHVSVQPDFAPDTDTLQGTLQGPATWPASSLSVEQTYYARLLAVNTSGERSDSSAIVSGQPEAAVAGEVLDGMITTVKLADDAVTKAKVALAAIGEDELADDSVVAGKIAALAVQAGTIAADAVQAGTVAADAITGRELAALSVTADQLAANAVTAGAIEAGAITADKLAALLVLASRLQLRDVDGNVTVDLDGATGSALFQGDFRTAVEGGRVEIATTGVVGDYKTIAFYPDGGGAPSVINSKTSGEEGSGAVEMRSPEHPSNLHAGRVWLDRGAAHLYVGVPSTGGGSSPDIPATVNMHDSGDMFIQGEYLQVDSRGDLFAEIASNLSIKGNAIFYKSNHSFTWRAGDRYEFIGPTSTGAYSDQYIAIYNSPKNGYSPFVYGMNTVGGLLFASGAIYVCREDQIRIPVDCGKLTCIGLNNKSSRTVKQHITELPFDALEAVQAAPVSEWSYTSDIDEAGDRYVGPMAEDLPEVLVGTDEANEYTTVNLQSMVGTLWESVRQLTDEVNQLRDELDELRAQVA